MNDQDHAAVVQAVWDRLLGYRHAFDHPVSLWMTIALAAGLTVTPPLLLVFDRLGKLNEKSRHELWLRYLSWLVLVPLLVIPILAGAAWTMLLVLVLSLGCYNEYARATGLFREKMISLLVVVGILAINFAVFDHWYGFFVALPPLTIGLIAVVAILKDQPQGYIQRVALGVLGYMLFGSGLAHLAYMANDADYRPIVLLLLAAVELNDVFAYLSGKTFGRRKLAPNTSPNKTIGGALGALVLTTALVAGLGSFIFRPEWLGLAGTGYWLFLVGLGVIVSAVGQLGDLMLSSIKRDLHIKDMGVTIPGHGGLLDRFDSLLLVAPATFHYLGYFLGFGLDQTPRIITTGVLW